MALDLTVSEKTDFRKDSKGHAQYTVTELFNFNYIGYTIVKYIDALQDACDNSTVPVDALDFISALDDMKEDMLSIESDGESYANEKSELKRAIEDLERFINENDLDDNELDWGDRMFEVHIWD